MAKNPLLTAMTAEEMLKIDYEQAIRLHNWAESAGLKVEPRVGARYYRIQYSTLKPKRSLFTIECNESRWRVKSSLYNFAQYSDRVSIPDPVKKLITATRTSTGCNSRCLTGQVDINALSDKLDNLLSKQYSDIIEIDFSQWGKTSTDKATFEELMAAKRQHAGNGAG